VLQVFPGELLSLLLHDPDLLIAEAHIELLLNLKKQWMLGVELLSPQLLQLLNLEIFVIVFVVKLVKSGTEFTLVGDQPLLEIFGNN